MSEHAQETQDLYALRRKKKRKRRFKRLTLLAALAAVVLVLYSKRDVWIPKLEQMGNKYQSVQQNDGTLSGGNFPLSVYGGIAYQTASMDDLLLILSDAYLYLYQTDGSLVATRQHAYGSAMLQTAGSYALVYESGGTHFRLETSEKTLFEKTTNDSIVFGRVSEDGNLAMVTASDTSACKMIVFDKKGKQIYYRSCVEELAEVSFSVDGKGCFAVSIRAENGVLKSVVHAYDFESTGERWTSEPLDMLCISVYNTKSNQVFVMGDTSCSYLDSGGAVLSTYVYPDALVCGDCVDGVAAILLRNDEKRSNSVTLFNGTTNNPRTLSFDSVVKYVVVSDDANAVSVQTKSKLETWKVSGELSAQTSVSDSYDRFIRINSYLFLMGYDRIDRLEYRDA